MITWLRSRLDAGWVEVEARPGQPVVALHGPTVRCQAAAGLVIARRVLGHLDDGEALVRAVIAGAPAPTWLVERHRLRTSGRRP